MWTLRCIADVLIVLYDSRAEILRDRTHTPVLSQSHWSVMLEYRDWLRKLVGMRVVDDALGPAVTYSCYNTAGTHHEELLRSVGVPEPLRGKIIEQLHTGPRRNVRATRKAATAMLFPEEISARAGVEIPPRAVLKAWHSGRLRFADDTPFVPIETDVRRAAHEEALSVCRREGFAPYIDLFEGTEIEPSRWKPLDPDALTDGDLERLASLLP